MNVENLIWICLEMVARFIEMQNITQLAWWKQTTLKLQSLWEYAWKPLPLHFLMLHSIASNHN